MGERKKVQEILIRKIKSSNIDNNVRRQKRNNINSTSYNNSNPNNSSSSSNSGSIWRRRINR